MSTYSITTLPFPRHIGIKHVKRLTLDRPLILSDGYNTYRVPAGETLKLYQSRDFGIVILDTPVNGRKLFRY